MISLVLEGTIKVNVCQEHIGQKYEMKQKNNVESF